MRDYWSMDINALMEIKDKEEKKLIEVLLTGTDWQETKDQIQVIAELSTIIYKKMNPGSFSNPAERAFRNHD